MQYTLTLLLLVSAAACAALPSRPWQLGGLHSPLLSKQPLSGPAIPADCKEHWHEQRLDHFHFGESRTFKQRYFVYDRHWRRPGGPIFFYCGNEGAVEGYINATGLMWENAQAEGALLLFAEHRYYGQTQPFGEDSWKQDPSFLSSEQALADYATLLWNLTRSWGAQDSPIIGFGGSYGGMLAAWMRIKYPHILDGAVSASAPVGAFPGIEGFDPAKFWEVVTRDATPAAGAADGCDAAVRAAFAQLLQIGAGKYSRSQLKDMFRLCKAVQLDADVTALAYWAQGAFDAYAMGNYPYASSYMTGDYEHPLPAWPMRAACQIVVTPQPTLEPTGRHHSHNSAKSSGRGSSRSSNGRRDQGDAASDLLARLRDAVGLLYNASGDVQCFEPALVGPAAGNAGPWDWQWCTEGMAQELPYFPATGTTDMFWDQRSAWDAEAIAGHCRKAWHVERRLNWAAIEYGGYDYRSSSNIVFSNGLMDPWSAYGIMQSLSDSVVAVTIPDGAHHLDLMFSHPSDSDALKQARATEMEHVRKWITQGHAKRQQGVPKHGLPAVGSASSAL